MVLVTEHWQVFVKQIIIKKIIQKEKYPEQRNVNLFHWRAAASGDVLINKTIQKSPSARSL